MRESEYNTFNLNAFIFLMCLILYTRILQRNYETPELIFVNNFIGLALLLVNN